MPVPPTTKITMTGTAAYSKLDQAEKGLAVAKIEHLGDDESKGCLANKEEVMATAMPIASKKMEPFAISTTKGRYPPPIGVSEGGVWGTNTYHGQKTSCTSFGCCLLCGGISACIVCCIPFDKRRAYLVEHKVYDANGLYIGGEDIFEDEEFDGDENKDRKSHALVAAGSVGTIFTLVYLIVKLGAN